MPQVIRRKTMHFRERDQTIEQISNGLGITIATGGELLTRKEATQMMESALSESEVSLRFLVDYATNMDIFSDGSVIKWQEVFWNEGEMTGGLSFDSLWSFELRRVGDSSFEILKSQIPRNAPDFSLKLAEQKRIKDEFDKARSERIQQEQIEYQEIIQAKQQSRERKIRIMHARRAAGRCEVCGRKIWPWTFRVIRQIGVLCHRSCENRPMSP